MKLHFLKKGKRALYFFFDRKRAHYWVIGFMAVDRREDVKPNTLPGHYGPPLSRPGLPGGRGPSKRTGARAEADASRDSARPAMAHAHGPRGTRTRLQVFFFVPPLELLNTSHVCIIASPTPKNPPRVSPPPDPSIRSEFRTALPVVPVPKRGRLSDSFRQI